METVDPDVGYYHLFSDGNGEFRYAEDGDLSVWSFPDLDGTFM
jgi:hypothetical protein